MCALCVLWFYCVFFFTVSCFSHAHLMIRSVLSFCLSASPIHSLTLFLGIIYLRSHMGKYLSVDSFGNVLCESDERDAGSRFQISITEDASGRWALRNESRGYFLGGTPDKLVCTAKAPSKGEFWTVHLAARPQVSAHHVPMNHKRVRNTVFCAQRKFRNNGSNRIALDSQSFGVWTDVMRNNTEVLTNCSLFATVLFFSSSPASLFVEINYTPVATRF